MAPVVVLPFHQDDRLDDDSLRLPLGTAARVVAPTLPAADRWRRLVALYDPLAAEVASTLDHTGSATVVSGDCVAALGAVAGMQRAGLDPSVVWFDAHGDLHTLATSTSGYLGGMALRLVLGGDAEKLGDPLGLRPVAQDRAVLVGARDLDPAEVSWLATAAVRRHAVEDVRAEDLPDGPVLLHVDADVVDGAAVPGLRFPTPGGPSTDTVLAAVRRLVGSGRVRVLHLACTWHAAADADVGRAHGDLLAELLDCAP